MKLYVINLDRAPERLARISGLIGDLGLTFERVPAIDGRLLPEPPRQTAQDAHRMTKTEIALVLSHRKCWDLFEQSGDEACVILEDDVHFGAGFAAFMTGYPPFPADFDLIKIETTPFKVWLDKHNPRRVMGDRKLMRLASPHMGAAGYVLSRAGLPKVRALAAAMKYPADVVLFGEPAKELIIYQLTPSLVIQDNALKKKPDYAALAGTVDRGRKPQVRGLRKVMRELGRPFRGIWPPGPITKKWRLTYGRVKFE